MALMKRSDLIYVDQLQEAVQAAFAGQVALFGTGAAIFSPTLPSLGAEGGKLKGGDTIRVPYFDAVGELDDVPEGGALAPQKLTLTSETSTVVHSGKAGEISNWAQLTAQFADPYAEYGRQFAIAWMRRIDAGLITKMATSGLSNDISGNAGPANQISWDAIIDTKQLWVDEQADIALIVAHSYVAGQLYKLKDALGRPLLLDPVKSDSLPTINGIPFKVSDRMPNTAGVYTTAICKRGALAAWANGTPTVDSDRDILADTDIVALHTYHVEHLYKRPATGTKTGVVLLKSK